MGRLLVGRLKDLAGSLGLCTLVAATLPEDVGFWQRGVHFDPSLPSNIARRIAGLVQFEDTVLMETQVEGGAKSHTNVALGRVRTHPKPVPHRVRTPSKAACTALGSTPARPAWE